MRLVRQDEFRQVHRMNKHPHSPTLQVLYNHMYTHCCCCCHHCHHHHHHCCPPSSLRLIFFTVCCCCCCLLSVHHSSHPTHPIPLIQLIQLIPPTHPFIHSHSQSPTLHSLITYHIHPIHMSLNKTKTTAVTSGLLLECRVKCEV